MKIFVLTLITALMALGVAWWWHGLLVEAQTELVVEKPSRQYTNQKYQYSINWPDNYSIDQTQLELVVMQNNDNNLRINVGCYAFGLENLRVTAEPVVVGGRPAMKEQFYDNYKLRLTRYTFTQNDVCYSLELWATTNLGREELEELIGSFQIH